MTQGSVGMIISGGRGGVRLRIWEEDYYIRSDTLGNLLFLNEGVPLVWRGPSRRAAPPGNGLVSLNPFGSAVLFNIGTRMYLVPRTQFIAVVFGELASTPLVEIVGDTDADIFPQPKGDAV